MAWLIKNKRKHPDTGRKRTYYQIAWRDHGIVTTKALGFIPATEAQKAQKIVEARLLAGLSPLEVEQPSPGPSSRVPTVGEFLQEEWLPTVRRDYANSTYKHEVTGANNLVRELGRLPLDRIDYARMDRFITKRRREGVRTRTVQLDVRVMKRALRHAERLGVLEAAPELPVVKVTDAKPHNWLSEEESRRLLVAAKPPEVQADVTRGRPPKNYDPLSYLAILMALNLGMRRGEIMSRGWEDVRWSRGPHGVLTISAKPAADFRVKTRRSRVIPLTPEVHKALKAQHEALGCPATGWIFPSPRDPSRPRKTFIRALKNACERAGLRPIHPHGLRHSWASRLAMAGVDRKALMELGGWKDGRMLDEIYAHVSDDHVAEIMSRVGLSPIG